MLVLSFHPHCLLSYLPFSPPLSALSPYTIFHNFLPLSSHLCTLIPNTHFIPLSNAFLSSLSPVSLPFFPHFVSFFYPSTCTFSLTFPLHLLPCLLSPTGLFRDQFSFAPVSCGGLAVLQVSRLSVATSSGNKKYGPLGFAGTIGPPYGPDVHHGRDNGPRRPPWRKAGRGDTDAVGP